MFIDINIDILTRQSLALVTTAVQAEVKDLFFTGNMIDTHKSGGLAQLGERLPCT